MKTRLTLAAAFTAAFAFLFAPIAGALFGVGVRAQTPATPASQAEAELVARAKGIHDRVITADTHNDISPNNFTADCNYTMRLTSQVNLPKMVEGGLDVSFMIAYVGQGALTPEGYDRAYAEAVSKFDAVHQRVLLELPNFTSASLDEPCDMPYAGYPTKFGALLLASHHEMLHAGQIGMLRRLLGKAPVR